MILGVGDLEPFDGRFNFATRNQERFGWQLPDAATIRFLFLNGDDVHGNELSDHLSQHVLVERKLVVIAETPCVGLEPNKVVTGFQIDDTEFGVWLSRTFVTTLKTPNPSRKVGMIKTIFAQKNFHQVKFDENALKNVRK